MEKTFTLERIMTISTTLWYITGGLIIASGYFGIKVYLGDVLKVYPAGSYALASATGLISAGLYLLKKFTQKQSVVIKVINKKEIHIYFNNKVKISAPISELKTIYTLHPLNSKKSSLQSQIIFSNGNINLYNEGNYKNKNAYDDFILYLEKQLKFTCRKASFSLRYSKHYVEYTNPLYNR